MSLWKKLKEGSQKKLRLTMKLLNLPKHRRSRQMLERYDIGERVMSNYTAARLGWYSGKVIAVDAIKGVYDIRYDDGDFESHVGTDRLRKIVHEDYEDDDDETTDHDEEDPYDNDNKKVCNDSIVAACQKYLLGKTLQGVVIDACMLNTTSSLVRSNLVQNDSDVVTIINREREELGKMSGTMHDLQQKCRGTLLLSSLESGDFLCRFRNRGERLNMIFLDYTQTLETIKSSGDLEILFGGGGLWKEKEGGVFGITLSLRGEAKWLDQEVKILSYLESVIAGKYVLTVEFRKRYGQMVFYAFGVETAVDVESVSVGVESGSVQLNE
jgi:hypothetical protein